MRSWRIAFMAAGLVIAAVGARDLIQTGFDNIVASVIALAVGVASHDFVLAPATIALTVVAVRVLPDWLRSAATLGLIVLGSATLIAIPVLGRWGARSDNATLLDRNYWVGWSVLAALVIVWVAFLAVRRRGAEREDGSVGQAEGGAR